MVFVKTLDGVRSENLKFVGLKRPFKDLRECQVTGEMRSLIEKIEDKTEGLA